MVGGYIIATIKILSKHPDYPNIAITDMSVDTFNRILEQEVPVMLKVDMGHTLLIGFGLLIKGQLNDLAIVMAGKDFTVLLYNYDGSIVAVEI